MKRTILGALVCLFGCMVQSQAIPSQITYQGTLKDSHGPVNGPTTMTFQLVSQQNSDGSRTPYSNIISFNNVNVNNGIFSVSLNFQLLSPYTWDTITPYILVSVNGQQLSPAEPINATVYALVSSAVSSNTITPSMMNTKAFQDPGPGLVPQGAIMMFDTNCPDGWTRYSAMDGNFPLGSATAGQSGGSATHQHQLPMFQDGPNGPGFGIVTSKSSPWGMQKYTDSPSVEVVDFTHGTTLNNLYVSLSAPGSSMPPYLTLIFCKKN